MRNAQLDNAKAALCILVIYGHCIESARASSDILKALYVFLYLLHMPALALLSGVVASRQYSRALLEKNIAALLAPFVVFEGLYEGAHFIIWGQLSHYAHYFEPYWLLWFLPSLFVWRMVLPLWSRLRFPVASAVFVACIVSTVMTNGYFLGVHRTFVFFPFFLIGATYRERIVTMSSCGVYRMLALICLVTGLYVSFLIRELPVGWVYGADSFIALQVTPLIGVLLRMFLYLVSTGVIVAFLAVVPPAQTFLGARAPFMIYAYLWHGFLIKLFEKWEVASGLAASYRALLDVLFLVISLVIFLLFSGSLIKQLTDRLLLKPITALLLRPLRS
jgi:fucose 4-O-acetylase-like acetyltransferase